MASKSSRREGSSFTKVSPTANSYPDGFLEGGVLVLADLMDEGGNDKRVLDLFTKHSHYRNITVIYLC